MNIRLCASLAMALSLVACGKEGGGKGASGKTGTHECKIIVAVNQADAKPETYKGEASGKDEEAVKEEAWVKACEALPEADRPDCRNNDKFKWAMGGGSATSGGETNYGVNITLTRVVEIKEFDGKATSDESKDKACAEATLLACKAAGAEGDCVAAGTHEERGRMASSTTMGGK